MKIITLDGYPASGKTEVREKLRREYDIIMPERFYSSTEQDLEKMWQTHNSGESNGAPYLSNFFPLLTFARIHPNSRVAQANYASIEGFYILLNDLIHRAGWEERDEMLWIFRNIIRLDFEFYDMTSYFINAPLSVCQSRRSGFPWGARARWDENWHRFWKWLETKGFVKFIDGTQTVKSIVEQIGSEVHLHG